jgi:DNA-binding NtrC family response regulator
MKRILVIDDNTDVLLSMKLLLKQRNFTVLLEPKPEAALQILKEHDIHLVLQDMNFEYDTTSGVEGLDLLKQIKKAKPHLPVILFSAWAHINIIVEGMKFGADNFFVKPWDNEKLLELIEDTLIISQAKQATLSRPDLDTRFNFSALIGEDTHLLQELETAGHVAKTHTNVLIRGENGTGKDLLAKAIHENSDRRDKPFIKVNTGGISTALFDSELFGHVKGAFTDAKQDRVGRFEAANGGTIFLDEIGDLALDSQVKLLRVIQEGRFERLGSSQTTNVDVRIIAATNINLEDSIAAGLFREDLYYRLNTIELTLPPLRERGDDCLLLARHFLQKFNLKYSKQLTLKKEGEHFLKNNAWLGNIRELEHTVERAVLMSKDDELIFVDRSKPPKSQLPRVGELTLDELEKEMILKTLQETGNNLTKTAKLLGINRTSLYRRLEKYHIDTAK